MSLLEVVKNLRLVAFDFDGVFTDNTVSVSDRGVESVRCWRGDGIGLKKLEELNINAVVISSETNSVVDLRCQKLGISCLTGVEDKLKALRGYLITAHSLDQVAFMGNDENDLECLQAVGLPIVPQDAHPAVMPFAEIITEADGGRGAVREVCDRIYEVRTGRRSEWDLLLSTSGKELLSSPVALDN